MSMRDNFLKLLMLFASPFYYSLFLEIISPAIFKKKKNLISQFTDTPVSAEMFFANY